MSTQATQCVVLVCDSCGQVDELPDGGETHYEDAATARQLTGQYGWTYADDRDLCPQCSAEAACARDGHIPDEPSDGSFCSRCEEPLDAGLSVRLWLPGDETPDKPATASCVVLSIEGRRRT